MKLKVFTSVTAAVIFAALSIPVRMTGQEQQDQREHRARHHRYVLKDLGTFGGPNSYVSTTPLEELLTNSGMAVGYGDTSMFEPFSPNINDDPFVEHAFVWKRGVLTDLGTLPKGFSSTAFAINDRGMIVGGSENGEIDPLTGFPQIEAVLWSRGQLIDLGTLGGNQSIAGAINNRGQVVGAALNAIPDPFANDFSLRFFAQPPPHKPMRFYGNRGECKISARWAVRTA